MGESRHGCDWWKDWFGPEGIVPSIGCSLAVVAIAGCAAVAIGWKILTWGGVVDATR